MSFKIITLGICNKLKTKFFDLYQNNNNNLTINKIKRNNIEKYNINLNKNKITIINKDYLNYFKESNEEYYKDINAIIIFFKSTNENVINDLKNIWFEELKNNEVPHNIPILIINVNCKNYEFEKKIFKNILFISDVYQSINYIPIYKNLNKKSSIKLIKITINKLIKKIIRIKN